MATFFDTPLEQDPRTRSLSDLLDAAVRAHGAQAVAAHLQSRLAAPAAAPSAQQSGSVGDAVTAGARTFARGVPIVGPLANSGNAAIAATLAPVVEPWLDRDPNHDRSVDVTPGGDWLGRYQRGLAIQNAQDARFDASHPDLSHLGQGAGAVLGTLAGGEVLAPLSTLNKARAAASLVSQTAAGAGDGALVGGLDGYERGHGGWTDPSRFDEARKDAVWGAISGGAMPSMQAGGEKLWDRVFGPRAPVGPGPDPLAALSLSPDGALASDAAAAQGVAPTLADALKIYVAPSQIQGPR